MNPIYFRKPGREQLETAEYLLAVKSRKSAHAQVKNIFSSNLKHVNYKRNCQNELDLFSSNLSKKIIGSGKLFQGQQFTMDIYLYKWIFLDIVLFLLHFFRIWSLRFYNKKSGKCYQRKQNIRKKSLQNGFSSFLILSKFSLKK